MPDGGTRFPPIALVVYPRWLVFAGGWIPGVPAVLWELPRV